MVLKSWVIFGDISAKKNTTYEAGSTIDRDLSYKINNKKRLLTNKKKPLLSAEAVTTDL